MVKTKTARCPRCSKSIKKETSDFYPFCSKLCKMQDLAAWAENGYVIYDKLDSDSFTDLAMDNKEDLTDNLQQDQAFLKDDYADLATLRPEAKIKKKLIN